jgi:hypothetical protein
VEFLTDGNNSEGNIRQLALFHSSYQGLGFKGWVLQHSGTWSLGVLGCDQSMSKVCVRDFWRGCNSLGSKSFLECLRLKSLQKKSVGFCR